MNIEQAKEKLLLLCPEAPDFLLVFTGKSSKKVHGLYKPDTREILIHSKNFTDDNGLMYTAIHEFAHHIHHTVYGPIITTRTHNSKYWQIFHALLKKAEELDIYHNPFRANKEFIAITEKIRKDYLEGNADLMKELGRLLRDVAELCAKHNLFFEDYIDRELNLQRGTVKTIMRVSEMDLPSEVGYENMKMLSSIKDPEVREEAKEAFLGGDSPDSVKGLVELATQKEEDKIVEADPVLKLEKEKEKIEKSIKNLNVKLERIEKMIEDYQ